MLDRRGKQLQSLAELDRLLLELDSEERFYLVLDGVAQREDVGGGGVASIDEGEGVAGGDSGVAHGVALDEAGALEQPGGGQLDAAVFRGPVGNLDPGPR